MRLSCLKAQIKSEEECLQAEYESGKILLTQKPRGNP